MCDIEHGGMETTHIIPPPLPRVFVFLTHQDRLLCFTLEDLAVAVKEGVVLWSRSRKWRTCPLFISLQRLLPTLQRR